MNLNTNSSCWRVETSLLACWVDASSCRSLIRRAQRRAALALDLGLSVSNVYIIYLFIFNKIFGYFGLNRNSISKTEPNRNFFRFKPN